MPTPPRTRLRVLELLSDGKTALTSTEIRERLGWPCSSGNVWAVIKKLHTERLIYIHSWKRSYGTRGAMGPRWKWGDKPDAPKPEKDRPADNRRYWANLDPLVKKLRTQKYKGRLNPWSTLFVKGLIDVEAKKLVRKKRRAAGGGRKQADGQQPSECRCQSVHERGHGEGVRRGCGCADAT